MAPEGRTSRLAKAAGAEPSGQMRDEKIARRCGAKHISKVKMLKTPHSDHFWKLRCRKSARRCGAKHISKSKCTKRLMFAPLLEVRMSKKCTPLWREGHFQVKMYKTPHVRATFGGSDVEKVHAVVARSTFRSQKCKRLWGTEQFWTFRCAFSVAGTRGMCTLSKVSKTRRFCSISKNDGRRGTFEEDLQRWISHGSRNTRKHVNQRCRRSVWSIRSSGLLR